MTFLLVVYLIAVPAAIIWWARQRFAKLETRFASADRDALSERLFVTQRPGRRNTDHGLPPLPYTGNLRRREDALTMH